MLKTYRVTSTFSARQLYREPVHYGVFHQGELLVGLRIAGDQIEFCRRDKPSDEDGKLEYALSEVDFLRDTDANNLRGILSSLMPINFEWRKRFSESIPRHAFPP